MDALSIDLVISFLIHSEIQNRNQVVRPNIDIFRVDVDCLLKINKNGCSDVFCNYRFDHTGLFLNIIRIFVVSGRIYLFLKVSNRNLNID